LLVALLLACLLQLYAGVGVGCWLLVGRLSKMRGDHWYINVRFKLTPYLVRVPPFLTKKTTDAKAHAANEREEGERKSFSNKH
jgi:hypothetical protein